MQKVKAHPSIHLRESGSSPDKSPKFKGESEEKGEIFICKPCKKGIYIINDIQVMSTDTPS